MTLFESTDGLNMRNQTIQFIMPYVQKLHYILNLISICGDFESATNAHFSARVHFRVENSKIPKTRNMAEWKLRKWSWSRHTRKAATHEKVAVLSSCRSCILFSFWILRSFRFWQPNRFWALVLGRAGHCSHRTTVNFDFFFLLFNSIRFFFHTQRTEPQSIALSIE